MNKKVVFLDMDGTLILRDGTMPESAQEALRRARANGHEMVICTGRSTTQIEPILKENSGLFDGCVAAAGAQVNRGDEIIWHDCMSPEMAQDLVSYFHENNVTFFLQADSGVYAEPSSMDNIVAAFKALGRTEEEIEDNSARPTTSSTRRTRSPASATARSTKPASPKPSAWRSTWNTSACPTRTALPLAMDRTTSK